MLVKIVTSILLCLNVIFIYTIIELIKANKKLKNRKTIDEEKNELKHELMELQESFKEKTIEAYLWKDKCTRLKKVFGDLVEKKQK
jgi:hypothetical protein